MEWKRHENWVESMKRYDTISVKPSFDIEKSIQTSKRLYCGCNFRFENDYLQGSIMFELIDEFKNPSIWFLLPDDNVVLFHFQGNKCYKYTSSEYGTEGGSIQYACVKFDKQGNMMKTED